VYLGFLNVGWVGCGPIIVQGDKDDDFSGVMSSVVHAQRFIGGKNVRSGSLGVTLALPLLRECGS
jgi:sensor domain CHASE-containing protein